MQCIQVRRRKEKILWSGVEVLELLERIRKATTSVHLENKSNSFNGICFKFLVPKKVKQMIEESSKGQI